MSRICTKCKESKKSIEFYPYKDRCKKCILADSSRKNSKTYTGKYFKTKKGKNAVNEASKRAYQNHKEKWIARAKARYAITKGIIIKPKKCEVCELVKPLQGHHEDYSKPLEVIFLCYSCHAEADKLLESNSPLID